MVVAFRRHTLHGISRLPDVDGDKPKRQRFKRAMALAASVTDASQFRSGREFAAWLGLTPRQHSSGGRERLGAHHQKGDKYLGTLLVVGMTSLIQPVKRKPETADPRLVALLACKPVRVATVAMDRHHIERRLDAARGNADRRQSAPCPSGNTLLAATVNREGSVR